MPRAARWASGDRVRLCERANCATLMPAALGFGVIVSVTQPRGEVMLERLERQEKLTANQWKIIATAGVGDMLDFFDFFLIGYVLAFILKDWHLTYGPSALILTSA